MPYFPPLFIFSFSLFLLPSISSSLFLLFFSHTFFFSFRFLLFIYYCIPPTLPSFVFLLPSSLVSLISYLSLLPSYSLDSFTYLILPLTLSVNPSLSFRQGQPSPLYPSHPPTYEYSAAALLYLDSPHTLHTPHPTDQKYHRNNSTLHPTHSLAHLYIRQNDKDQAKAHCPHLLPGMSSTKDPLQL